MDPVILRGASRYTTINPVVLQDRNGPAKVDEQRNNIDTTFADISSKLFAFGTEMLKARDGSSRIEVKPAQKFALFNSFYNVARTHLTVAEEFLRKLQAWTAETLVPAYKSAIDEALVRHDAATICKLVSHVMSSFTSVCKITSNIFHSIENLSSTSEETKPVPVRQMAFEEFFRSIFQNNGPRVQELFLRHLTSIRDSQDPAQLEHLQPIADFFREGLRLNLIAFDDNNNENDDNKNGAAAAATSLTSTTNYKRFFIDKYTSQMVSDIKATIAGLMLEDIPLHNIGDWIQSRANFERQAVLTLVAPDNNSHESIMNVFYDEVAADYINQRVPPPMASFSAPPLVSLRQDYGDEISETNSTTSREKFETCMENLTSSNGRRQNQMQNVGRRHHDVTLLSSVTGRGSNREDEFYAAAFGSGDPSEVMTVADRQWSAHSLPSSVPTYSTDETF